jgi:SAM-dependent methyltransferase
MQTHGMQDQPSGWVSRFAGLIPPGLTLDLACGSGRHARLLSALGHRVLAVDQNEASLAAAQGEGITPLCFDLEAQSAATHPDWPFVVGRFCGIVVTNYLHRPLFAPLLASLADGGVLIYETFTQGNGHFGKPSNPSFLLTPGELLTLTGAGSGLRVLAFEEGYVALPKPAMIQRICLIKTHAALNTDPASLRL